MNEQINEPTSPAAPAAKSPMRMYILLGILVVMGGVLALTLPAKGKWQAAQESAQAALEAVEGDPPVALMKAIGMTPMVKEDKDGLTQVYRWSGGVKTYELKLKFGQLYPDKPGIYEFPTEVVATAKPFFMADSLEGYTEAHEITGSTYAKLAELEMADPLSQGGGPSKAPKNPGGTLPEGPARPVGLVHRPPPPPQELNLTEDQKTKWRAATTKMAEASKEIFNGKTPRSELTKKMREVDAAFQESLKSFLTPEQLDKFAEINSRSRRPTIGGTSDPTSKKGGGGFGKGRPGGGFGRSSGPPEELKLTDEQKAKWTAATEKMRGKFSGLRELPREERGAKYREVREEFQKELKTFLTEEQMKQYEKIRSERFQKGKGGKGGGGFGRPRPGSGKKTP